VIVAALGVAGVMKVKGSQSGPKLILGKVEKHDLIETISATGSVNAQTGAEVHIGSQITGVIKRLNADVGTRVKAGDLIAELDLPDLKANVEQSRQALAQAVTKYVQEVSGVGLQHTTIVTGIGEARATAESKRAELLTALANYRLQLKATPTDIDKARSALGVAQAALSTAQSNVQEVNTASDLSVSNANEQLAQAQANATNAGTTRKRLEMLVAKGYAAQADLDTAVAQAKVYDSQVRAADQNLKLTVEKVALDKQNAQDQLKQAQQNLTAAQAALEAALAEVNTTAARQADVRDSQEAIKVADEAVRLAEADKVNDLLKSQDVKEAKEAVEQAKATLAYNLAQYNKSFIRSPISGTVLTLSVQQGETLAAGLSAPTVIVVADLSRMQIDAYVDETDIGKVKLHQHAKATVDAFPDRVFDGEVQKIASGSTIQQGVVTYDVTIQIKDPDEVLKPDMTANVDIETGRVPDALLVPAVAVHSGTNASTVNVLQTVNGRKQSVPVQVEIGGTDGVSVEIKKGLSEGEQIVLAGQTGPSRTAPNPFGPRSQGSGGAGGGGGGGGGGGR
jgi:RND family efflux transporter MFP subunit